MGTFDVKVLGVIEGCTNPESAELLPDGETIVISNCALTLGVPEYRGGAGLVYLPGEAFISRARIDERGGVSLEERHFVDGLTATHGLDVLRTGTHRFPAGTVFVQEGGNPQTRDRVGVVDDARPRALAFDASSGSLVGEIPLGPDSAIGQALQPFDQPNGIGIDSQGNLFLGDMPGSSQDPTSPPERPSALYRVPVEAIDALASGASGSASGVRRLVMPGNVNGITIAPDDTCHAVSCAPFDPVKGGIYSLPTSAFDSGQLPAPLVSDLGILDGVGVTRRGTMIASNPVTGELFAFREDGERLMLAVADNPVAMPADINVAYPRALDGEPALLVPDISVGRPPGTSTVAVLDISGL